MRKNMYVLVVAMFLAVSTSAHAGVGITNTWFSGSYHYWSGNQTLNLKTQQSIVGLCKTEIWGKKNGNLSKIKTRWNNGHNNCPISINQISLINYSQQWDNMEIRFIRNSNGQRIGTATFKVVVN